MEIAGGVEVVMLNGFPGFPKNTAPSVAFTRILNPLPAVIFPGMVTKMLS
jgi:hypothetical protein